MTRCLWDVDSQKLLPFSCSTFYPKGTRGQWWRGERLIGSGSVPTTRSSILFLRRGKVEGRLSSYIICTGSLLYWVVWIFLNPLLPTSTPHHFDLVAPESNYSTFAIDFWFSGRRKILQMASWLTLLMSRVEGLFVCLSVLNARNPLWQCLFQAVSWPCDHQPGVSVHREVFLSHLFLKCMFLWLVIVLEFSRFFFFLNFGRTSHDGLS